ILLTKNPDYLYTKSILSILKKISITLSSAEVSPDDAVPGRVVLLIKLLKLGSNVLLYVVFLHGLCGTVHGVLLHLLGHVSVLDHRLPVSHC
uniref:Uncharacterized protein n=1 Tax=Oryzias melastigma TaxID=30732 RepID=A0A3B3BCF6_ORYME